MQTQTDAPQGNNRIIIRESKKEIRKKKKRKNIVKKKSKIKNQSPVTNEELPWAVLLLHG